MKKIIVLVMVLMLVGCQNNDDKPLEMGDTIEELLITLQDIVKNNLLISLNEDEILDRLDTIEKQTYDFELNTCTDIDDDETYIREDCYYDMDGVIDVFNDMHGWIEIDDRGYVVIYASTHDVFYLYDHDGVPRSSIPLEKWIVEDKSGIGGRYLISDEEIEMAITQWNRRNMPILMEAYLKMMEETK
jgi:hypothetical protein